MLQMDEKDLQIAEKIRRLPDLEPPPELLDSVMSSIQPKRLAGVARLVLWAKSPKTITWTPLRAISAAVAVLIVLGGAVLLSSGKRISRLFLSRRVGQALIRYPLPSSFRRAIRSRHRHLQSVET